jgi:hypothetical protein
MMGVIKNVLLVFVSILLFFSFFLTILFISLSSSLTYNNVQNQAVSLIHGTFLQNLNLTSFISENYEPLQYYCQNNNSYSFNAENYTFNISCSAVTKGQDAILEEGLKQLINQIYYEDYGCEFFKCFKQQKIPFFLISKLAHNSFFKFFLFSLLASLILGGLAFLLIEKKTSLPILAGSVLIIASLPFMKIGNLLNLFSGKIYIEFLKIFFSQSRTVAIIFLILSGVLIIAGVVLKIFGVGMSVSKFASNIKKKSSEKKKDTK